MNIALLALLGVVSAADLKRHTKRFESVRLDDNGFIVLGEQSYIKKESDWLANGDEKDDLEVQSEFDKEDPVVMDNGFGLGSGNIAKNEWTSNQYKGSLRDFVQLNSNTHMKAKRESDWIANADAQDDKECESELGDGSDEIVTDNGFALAGGNWADNKWTRNHYDPDLMFLMSQHQIHLAKAKKHHKHHNKPATRANVQLKKESDWIANADAADDKEVESELGDAEDEIVMDNGFALSSGIWEPNKFKNDQYNAGLNFVQLDAEDHFYTDDFKEAHPHKLVNSFYQRGEQPDIMNMQLEYNEIDNYNPRAQARLAKYAEFM